MAWDQMFGMCSIYVKIIQNLWGKIRFTSDDWLSKHKQAGFNTARTGEMISWCPVCIYIHNMFIYIPVYYIYMIIIHNHSYIIQNIYIWLLTDNGSHNIPWGNPTKGPSICFRDASNKDNHGRPVHAVMALYHQSILIPIIPMDGMVYGMITPFNPNTLELV